MALKNINMESVLRGVLETRAENLSGILETGSAKLAELGVEAGKPVSSVARHEGRRNPLRGQLKGSANFNGRSVIGWIESIGPAVVVEGREQTAEEAQVEADRQEAVANLQALVATIKSRKL
jgi:hypothetical protein